MAPARSRSAGRKRTTAAGVALPPDLLNEIFLRLPAGAACRFRAVSRSWLAILSCRRFAAAHLARHGPLLVAGAPYLSSPRSWHVDLLDLAGDIVRRTRTPEAVTELLTCGGLACAVGEDSRAVVVLDPVTGAVTRLPHGLSERNTRFDGRFRVFTYAFGRAASTETYKLLRILNVGAHVHHCHAQQLVEILTLDDAGATSTRWRGVQGPPFAVAGAGIGGNGGNGIAMVNSVAYFAALPIEHHIFDIDHGNNAAPPGTIAPFSLETETWMPVLRGPLHGGHQEDQDDPMYQQQEPLLSPLLNLAELKGFLVAVRCERLPHTATELWFLTDSKEETWVRKYSIQIELCPRRREFYAHPLFVLDDSKIVLRLQPEGGLLVYDLQKGTYRGLNLRKYAAVGLYKDCLLSLGGVTCE